MFVFHGRGSRSSLHYDPYQNLLCVVRGAKTVRLHAPQQMPALYPRPVHGEVIDGSALGVPAGWEGGFRQSF